MSAVLWDKRVALGDMLILMNPFGWFKVLVDLQGTPYMKSNAHGFIRKVGMD